MTNLMERVGILERTVRRQRLLGVAAILLLVCWATMGQQPVENAPERLRARSFELVDAAGAVKSRWGLTPDGQPHLALLDPQGQTFWQTPTPAAPRGGAGADARSAVELAFAIDETWAEPRPDGAPAQPTRLIEQGLAAELLKHGFQVYRPDDVPADSRKADIQRRAAQSGARRILVIAGAVTLSVRPKAFADQLLLAARTDLLLREARDWETVDAVDAVPMVLKGFGKDVERAQEALRHPRGSMPQLARMLVLQLHALYDDDDALERHFQELREDVIAKIPPGETPAETEQAIAENMDLLQLLEVYQSIRQRRK